MHEIVELTPNLEDYLETVYKLEKERKVARVSDIAQLMNVTQPSVVGALKKLDQKKLVEYERYSLIALTATGEKVARGLSERFIIIKEFMEKVLDIPAEKATAQACKIEHFIDNETVRRLCRCTTMISTIAADPDSLFSKSIAMNGLCSRKDCQRSKNLLVV